MREILLITCIVLIAISGCSKRVDPYQEVVKAQFQRYPQMQVQDLYKLVYQAAMGNIHLGIEPSVLKNYLIGEMEKIEASDNEPLVEEIAGDGMVRVNLRPFKANDGDPIKLFEAMMQTADSFHPRKEKLNEYWKAIGEMADDRSLPFSRSQLDSFFVTMQEQDFPAVHHSEAYSQAYQPAYRVILKAHLPAIY